MDTLLCEKPDLIRKCAKIEVKPLYNLNIMKKASPILKNLLTLLKDVKYLSLTNIVKFVKKLLDPKIKAHFFEEVEGLNQLKDQDKFEYINRIRVVVCYQKCPCCGRICGLEN